ncbi:MAG: DUF2239 family protein [Caulobacteraceae bacterium]
MEQAQHIAFYGARRIATGNVIDVALTAKSLLDNDPAAALLIFDTDARPVDIDFRGGPEDVRARLEARFATPPRGPGRPKLGVTAREVTLLPRHWDWLSRQPGGASVALRKLVERASRDGDGAGRVRRAQEIAYRFMSAMAGNEPGFEEAARALFGGNRPHFEAMTATWPEDVRAHAMALATGAFE